MSSQNRAKTPPQKKQNKKYKNKNKMCRGGGGGNLLYLLCLISNTMPQLEQSSLQPSTDLHHRHPQTTSYNHLLLLHLLISRKGKLKQQQARNPPYPAHYRIGYVRPLKLSCYSIEKSAAANLLKHEEKCECDGPVKSKKIEKTEDGKFKCFCCCKEYAQSTSRHMSGGSKGKSWS